MNRRVALSPEGARLIAQALSTCRGLADEALRTQRSAYSPAGTFKVDLDAISAASAEVRQVRSQIHATGIEGADYARMNAIDHIRSLESDVLREPVPIWSPLTLCRAALESTAVTCHLLDSAISTDDRLARMAALWLADTPFAANAAGAFGAIHAEGVREYGRFKLSELAAGGFVVERNDRDRPVKVRLGAASASLTLNITAMATQLLPPGMPSPYRLGSGAAHSRPWLLERSVTRTPDGGYIGEAATAETAAFTVIFCMKAWVTTWGAYFGVEVNEALTAMDAAKLSLGQGIVADATRHP